MTATLDRGPRVTRRRALGLAAAAGGAALLGLVAPPLVRSVGSGGGPLPPVARLRGELVAAPAAGMLLYNGAFPGPLIEVSEGDRVRLRFVNRLDEPSNLHLHGLHVSPAVDRPFLHVSPGEVATYEWEVESGSAGTYWYHPHFHGRVAAQLLAGLTGPMIIRGPLDQEPELQAADERLLVLRNTVEHDGRMLVNGAIAPRMAARRGTLRLRLLNASTQEYVRLGFEHLPMHLIATDAGLVERPVELAELLLSPGERAEVLTVLDGRGEHRLMRLPYARAGGATREEPEPLLTVDATSAPRATSLPGHLRSIPALHVGRGDPRRRVTFGVARTGEYLINGRAFDHQRVEYRPRTGTTEVWELVNEHTSDHSFHLHSWPFQVLDRNGRPEPFRAWRDVVNLRGGERVRIAIPFRHFGGRTVFHCHNAEHEDGGMMAVIDVLGGSQHDHTTEEPRHAHH